MIFELIKLPSLQGQCFLSNYYQNFLLNHSEFAGLVGQSADDEIGLRQRGQGGQSFVAVENYKLKGTKKSFNC